MQATANGFADFTGVLVQRQYQPGQKYIQLVFKTAEGIRLSLSRNLAMVRELTIGHAYRVRGQEFALGKKTYIHEPLATPVTPASKNFIKSHVKLVVAIGIVLSFGGVSAAALTLGGNDAAQAASDKPTASKVQIQTETPVKSTSTAAATAPAATAPATNTGTAKKTTSSTTKTVAQSAPAAATPPATTQSPSTSSDTPATPAEADQSASSEETPVDVPPAVPIVDPLATDPTE